MNVKLIEKLEHTTPTCPECRGTSKFVIGCAYLYLQCDKCSLVFNAPKSLTRTIVAAYHLPPVKNTTRNRIQPCIL